MDMVCPDLLNWWVFGDTLVFKLVSGAPLFLPILIRSNIKFMEIVKEKTIAFTGNRILTSSSGKEFTVLKLELYNKLYTILEQEYLENGYNTFLCGMALGFDTIAALATIQLRQKYKA